MEENLNYIVRAKKFRAKKSLGQNFLIDSNVVNFIVDNADCDDEILEIGPGLGFVTEGLVERAKNVVALEIDKDAINILQKNLGSKANFNLFEKDILKTNLDELPFKKDKIKVIANIPYYITSPILVHLLGEIDDINNKNRACLDELILMVQYEVAKRIVADENASNKEYGQLSILSQMYCDCEILKIVSKKSFMPSPKVDSAIVRFKVRNNPKVEITRLLKRTVKAIFMARRKNVKNSLLNAGFLGVNEALDKIGIDIQDRGEKLSIETISKLAKALEEYN